MTLYKRGLDPVPAGRVPQDGQGVGVAVHVVVADAEGDGDRDVRRVLLRHKRHEAPEGALAAEILQDRDPLRMEREERAPPSA